jgi:hypothetical protein
MRVFVLDVPPLIIVRPPNAKVIKHNLVVAFPASDYGGSCYIWTPASHTEQEHILRP